MNKTAPGAATPGTAIGATNYAACCPFILSESGGEINAKKEYHTGRTGGRDNPKKDGYP